MRFHWLNRPTHWLDRSRGPGILGLIFRRTPVPAQDPLSEMSPSRHPFQTFIMVACMIGGVGNLFHGSPAMVAAVSPLLHIVWSVSFVVGGFMALVGAHGQDRITGLLLERTALLVIGIASMGWGAALFLHSGPDAIASGPLTLLTGVACFWRMRQVVVELRKLRNFMQRRMVVQDAVDEDGR